MADSKLSALTQLSVPTLDDYLYIVDDPAGTPASKSIAAHRLLGQFMQVRTDGRLTLVTGNPVYAPQPQKPASTDTTAETTDFTNAHGWVSGTIVMVAFTVGGLTWNTKYYVNVVNTTRVSYHTTLADGLAGTNKVNLTASITAMIRPIGFQSATLYFTPMTGNLISVYDGTRWKLYTFTELTLALGTLSSGAAYDVFIYDNAGTLTLEFSAAWASSLARTDALTTQDGVLVKSGATTRRYLGTIYTVSTLLTELSQENVFVWNHYNRVRMPVSRHIDTSSSYTYSTATWRQARASTVNKVSVIVGWPYAAISLFGVHEMNGNNANSGGSVAFGLDNTSTPHPDCVYQLAVCGTATRMPATCRFSGIMPLGYHDYDFLEMGDANGTITWLNYETASTEDMKPGMQGFVDA